MTAAVVYDAGEISSKNDRLIEAIFVTIVGAVALAGYAQIFLVYLPGDGSNIGSDFSYFLPQLQSGYYWYLQNSAFSIPWFSPAFCAGVPYYPNLQGLYLSVPQFLMFAFSPVLALQITFLGFAAAGYVGFYFLLRLRFCVGMWMSMAGAVFFMFNGFFYSHYLAGHLPFHAYMLTPLLAVFAMGGNSKTGWLGFFDAGTLLGSLIVAYMVQSGMVHAFAPSMLSIVGLMLIHAFVFGGSLRPYMRLLVIGVLGMLLSVAKLVAALAFLHNFHRDMLPVPGYPSLLQSAFIQVTSLFLVPPTGPSAQWFVNNEWYPGVRLRLGFWELDAGVTIVPLLLLLVAFAVRAVARLKNGGGSRLGLSSAQTYYLLLLAPLLIAPVVINWYNPTWNAFLKSLPIIGNSSTLVRWHCLYIPLVIVFSVLAIDRLSAMKQTVPIISLASILLAIYIHSMIKREYRLVYDPTEIISAYAAAKKASLPPPVRMIEEDGPMREMFYRYPGINNRFLRGATGAQCYEPMFGHKLEEYPFGNLHAGPALSLNNGSYNVKNPACMVYPGANQCRPGDHFTAAQSNAARDFLDYKAFQFELPWWQRLANWFNLMLLLGVLAGLVRPALSQVSGLRRPA